MNGAAGLASHFYRISFLFFFFSSRRRHTRFKCDWSSDVCSSDLFPFSPPASPVAHILQWEILLLSAASAECLEGTWALGKPPNCTELFEMAAVPIPP